MDIRQVVLACALLGVFVAASCTSTQPEQNSPSLVWKEGTKEQPATGAAPAVRPASSSSSASEGRVLTIPEDVMKEIMAFVNREQFILADRIDVDASRIPFKVAMVRLADIRYVEEIESASVSEKIQAVTLRSRVKRPAVEKDFPRLRIGDGIDLVAGREIQARTYTKIDEKRPIFLNIVARGHAVYQDVASGRRLEQDVIRISFTATNRDGELVLSEVIR
jgi:hypothetical protein